MITWKLFSNLIVSDKEEKIRVRLQGWHEHNHTWYNIRMPKRYGVSHEGKYLFRIPCSGAVLGWGLYILEHLWNTPSPKTLPWDKQLVTNCDLCCILIWVGLLMDHYHPATRQMLKIRRLGFYFPMMTVIQTTGYTHWW